MYSRKSYIGCVIFILAFSYTAFGQGNLKVSKRLLSCTLVSEYPIVLSTLKLKTQDSIIENIPIEIKGDTVKFSSLECDFLLNNEVWVEYRIFPFKIRETYSLFDSSQIEYLDQIGNEGIQIDMRMINSDDQIDITGLDYNGSFSRGFSIGNAQDLILNSNFDLQMVGDLGYGIQVRAAISDDNIPIQPEGNTQVLQEFDRIYIELEKDSYKVIAGDYALKRPKSHFINYNKKLKGLGAQADVKLNDNNMLSTKANISSSRGKFRRQIVDVVEGNQGPYQLIGNNNERFLIILSGTEKVYFNGELMHRGIDYDYVIDYNRAQISFSPKRLVARESRVIVEFEYTDQNYFRTLYSLETNLEHKNYNLNFNFYSEQDSKNSTSQIQLDSLDRSILQAAGDDPLATYRSGIRPYNEDNNALIGYRLKEVPGVSDKVLEFTSEIDSIDVEAVFTEVGEGEGSYRISDKVSSNGRVYEYVGEGNGAYEPIVRLIPPNQKRAMALGGDWKIRPEIRLHGELALSDFDENRFSSEDDHDNIGLAGNIGVDIEYSFTDSSAWKWLGHQSFEWLDNDYNVLNPYRNAEFIRDWNLNDLPSGGERLTRSSIGLRHKSEFEMIYSYEAFDRYKTFQGNRQKITGFYNKNDFRMIFSPTYTVTHSGKSETSFLRPIFELSKKFSNWKGIEIGSRYEGEYNSQKENNELTTRSYSFDQINSFLQFGSDERLKLRFGYNHRLDRFVANHEFYNALRINEFEWTTMRTFSNNRVELSFKLRDFDVVNEELVTEHSDKRTLLGSALYQASWWKGGVVSNTNYQINSGQEPKTEFVYQKVENIQGEYVYIGSDTSGVKDVNDFRYDPTNPLAQYVRLSLPNNEFIRTNNIILDHNIRILPSKIWSVSNDSTSGLIKMIRKFSLNTRLNIFNKSMDSKGSALDPLAFYPSDSTLVSYTQQLVQGIYYNRGNALYDVGYDLRFNRNKSNQINGFESRGLIDHRLKFRWTFDRQLDVTLVTSFGRSEFDSEIFDPRDFEIDHLGLAPELSWRLGTTQRIVMRYAYKNKKQRIGELEKSRSHSMECNYTLRKHSDYSFDGNVRFVDVRYSGEVNSPIAYDILEGLRGGSNYLWRMTFTKRMINNIDLSLVYNGRKTGNQPVIHVGNIQAKATF